MSPSLLRLKHEALAAQRAGLDSQAESWYRHVLAESPDDADALNMLGALCLKRGDCDQAVRLMHRSLEVLGWQHSGFRGNLLVALEAALRRGAEADARLQEKRIANGEREVQAWPAEAQDRGLVTIVIPCFNHGPYVRQALQSVFAQTYREIEIIVIDDGSTDNSAEVIADALLASPFPHRFVRRENRGKSATANEGAALCRGEWIHFLHSDDAFHPERIARMLSSVLSRNARWGFSATRFIDGEGEVWAAGQNTYVDGLRLALWAARQAWSVSLNFVRTNIAISPGNLLMRRGFYHELGGFRAYRANEDWDFCMRAIWLNEPVFLDQELFDYRVHGANTASTMPRASIVAEAEEIIENYLVTALTEAAPNPLAPSWQNWGELFLATALGVCGVAIPSARLAQVLRDWPRQTVAEDLRAALLEALRARHSGNLPLDGQWRSQCP